MRHTTKMFVIVPAVTALTLLSSVFSAGVSKINAMDFLRQNPEQVKIITGKELDSINLDELSDGVLILPIEDAPDVELPAKSFYEVYDVAPDGTVVIHKFYGNSVDTVPVHEEDFDDE